MSDLYDYEEEEEESDNQKEEVQESLHPSILPLYGDIDPQNCYSLYFNMMNLVFSPNPIITPKTNPVLVMPLTTDGGEVDYALGLIGLMKCLQNIGFTIKTIAIGVVASAGSLVYLAGNERVCVSTSKLMFHDMSARIEGPLSNLKANTNRLIKLKKELAALISHYSNLTPSEVSKKLLTHEDRYVSAKELKLMGMCDTIIR